MSAPSPAVRQGPRSAPRSPVATVGVVGGGQLGRMLAAAASRLAVPVRILARDPHEPAAEVAGGVVVGSPDAEGLRALAEVCDVLTVEHELVDLPTLRELEAEGHRVRPSADTLAIAVDKVAQRERLAEAGVAVSPWTRTTDERDVAAFAERHGWPLIAKAPRGAYDGRGVWEVADLAAARRLLEEVDDELLLEPLLEIDMELAVLVARRPGGELVVYPPVETVQEDAMCREVLLPASLDDEIAEAARHIGATVAEAVESVGILAVELFLVDGRLWLNELAARPHNAGHPTIEGSVTDQFENHLRAVLDLPLGSTRTRAPAAMVNVVGVGDVDPRTRLAAALAEDEAAVHLYDKEPRDGRKLGHVTATGEDTDDALAYARRAAAALTDTTGATTT